MAHITINYNEEYYTASNTIFGVSEKFDHKI